MSLHRILAPPPLALAVHPAPAPKTRKERKQEEEEKQAARELRHKKRDEEKKAKELEAKLKAEAEGKGEKVEDGKEEGVDADKKGEEGKDDEVKAGDDKQDAEAPKDKDAAEAKTATGAEDKKDEEKEKPKPKPERPLVPIRLLAPAPAAPVHARIDLDPSKPYPPLPIDPRGAYHKYAKALGQTEDVYIDVTKDGWLAPIWKERTEREALARLTGEAERQHFRETLLAKEREMAGYKVLPETAQEVVLELWNALVDAPSAPFREIDAETFWSRYDWTTPEAQKHLQVVPKEHKIRKVIKVDEDKTDNKPVDNGGEVVEKTKDALYQYPITVEWTREGVEEVLSTVGIIVGYNTAQALPSRGWSPPSGLMVMTHGHFLLRLEDHVNYKPEGTTDKFEALVTTANDRVFGDMVVAQLNEEKRAKEKRYRARKEQDYRERKAAEAKAAADKEKKAEAMEVSAKVEPLAVKAEAVDGAKAVGIAPIDGGAIVANPVEAKAEAADLDAKHEAEAVIAAPAAKDAKPKEKDAKPNDKKADPKKDKADPKSRPFDPVREAEMIAKMLGPEAANIPLAELKAAFQAMEAANAAQKVETAQAVDVADPAEPIIWMWSGSEGKCERWRWRNYAVGCGELEEGCWEERDWKVFADDAGCEQFEEEQQWQELGDVDVHDWSC